MAWKSGLKVSLLLLGPSCHLQTILLSDLVWCGSLLQIVMANWHTFLNLKRAKQPLKIAVVATPDPASTKFKKSAPNGHWP
jgi:hypothetical protein